MRIAYVVYPGFTALDLIGPYEVTCRWPGAEVHLLSTTDGPVTTDRGLTFVPTDSPATLPDPDMVVVPGAENPLPVLKDEALLEWVRGAAKTATWMASVCTGAGIYAAAGLLDGRPATTHWAFRENLKAMGVDVRTDRVVFDDPFVSGAGVSAGIDMALALTRRVHGDELAKALQLGIEYDPQPPFDTGAPGKADASTLRIAAKLLLGDRPGVLVDYARHLVGARVRRVTARR